MHNALDNALNTLVVAQLLNTAADRELWAAGVAKVPGEHWVLWALVEESRWSPPGAPPELKVRGWHWAPASYRTKNPRNIARQDDVRTWNRLCDDGEQLEVPEPEWDPIEGPTYTLGGLCEALNAQIPAELEVGWTEGQRWVDHNDYGDGVWERASEWGPVFRSGVTQTLPPGASHQPLYPGSYWGTPGGPNRLLEYIQRVEAPVSPDRLAIAYLGQVFDEAGKGPLPSLESILNATGLQWRHEELLAHRRAFDEIQAAQRAAEEAAHKEALRKRLGLK